MQKYFTKINIETKSIDETGMFAGYASMFNVVDSMGDAILPGAFRETLKENQSIKLLWQHDATQPIGIITKISEDIKGLYIEGKIMTDLSKGKEAFDLMSLGVIDSLSIGFQVEDFFYANSIRFIKKLKLWEVSVVTFPANQFANLKSNLVQKLDAALDNALKIIRNKIS